MFRYSLAVIALLAGTSMVYAAEQNNSGGQGAAGVSKSGSEFQRWCRFRSLVELELGFGARTRPNER